MYILDLFFCLGLLMLGSTAGDASLVAGFSLDAIFHVVFIIMLLIGIRNRKPATVRDEELPEPSGAAAEAVVEAVNRDEP